MAKRVRSGGGAAAGPVAILLVTLTAKAYEISPQRREKHRNDITKRCEDAGGKCQLFQATGGIYEYVSIVKGISDTAKLLDLVQFLESLGDMKAVLMLAGPKKG
jgi:uncharacterized protein with GYD domain